MGMMTPRTLLSRFPEVLQSLISSVLYQTPDTSAFVPLPQRHGTTFRLGQPTQKPLSTCGKTIVKSQNLQAPSYEGGYTRCRLESMGR